MDTAIYETFARMSQDWINNLPEVSWHGANGNIVIGNAPASSRYTEARLSKAAEDGMFQGIKKNNVNMILNFSEDEEWPEVLPSIMPRLLINGSQGIGVTIANVWLPMNLIEITEAIKNYILSGMIDNNTVFPDFPSGGIIINKDELHTINETGKGKVILRARTEIKNNSIFITELPYQVFVEPLLEDIKKLISEGQLEDIKDIYNKTDKKRLLIEIECKNSPETTLNKLFALTDLQKNYNANQYALVGKTPKLLNLKEYFDIYINHNSECISKEYIYDLNKATERLEIVNGLLKALEDIDNIISLIKSSKSAVDAKNNLIKEYNFSENQAKAIVDMKLGKIANLEKIEIEEEQKKLNSTIENCNNILSNKKEILNILIDRLINFTKKYGKDRKTLLENIKYSKEEKEIAEVIPEDVVVMLSKTGNIKRIPKASFRTQRKGGKGVKTADDVVMATIKTNTIDTLLLFTNEGKMYRIIVDNIPEGTNASKGVNISTLINLENNEKVIAVTNLERENENKYVVFITKQGLFKKTLLEEYIKTKRSTGIAAINLKDGDSIANIELMNDEDMIIITKKGYSIHFETKEIAAIGRVTAGVKAIKLTDDDEVLVGLPIRDKKETVAVFSSFGNAKKTNIDEFPLQMRAGRGVKCCKDEVVGAVMLNDENEILICGNPRSICILGQELPLLKRDTVGNLMIKDSIITSVVKI